MVDVPRDSLAQTVMFVLQDLLEITVVNVKLISDLADNVTDVLLAGVGTTVTPVLEDGLLEIVTPAQQTLSLLENAAGVALAGLEMTATPALTDSFLQLVIRSVMDSVAVTIVTVRVVSRTEDGKEYLAQTLL